MISEVLTFNALLYLLIPVAFLSGSIPFGIIFTRRAEVDIRSRGSRNIGATNVLRLAGKKPAILTLLGDLIKGALPAGICIWVIKTIDLSSQSTEFVSALNDVWTGITGLSAVLGHMYSLFLSFRGGKGVATGFGFLLVYSPAAAGITLFMWIAVALLLKYSSLAAITAVAVMPLVLFLLNASSIKISVGIILALLIIYRHKSNIKKFMDGTETKV